MTPHDPRPVPNPEGVLCAECYRGTGNTRRTPMPERLQLSRKAGWRLPLNAKSVARPHAWGNPFRVSDMVSIQAFPDGRADRGWGCAMPITAQLAVDLFRAWQICRPENVAEIRSELAGLDLACWCPLDMPCHADVLLELANS